MSDISALTSPAHAHRCRRFTVSLTGRDARLAEMSDLLLLLIGRLSLPTLSPVRLAHRFLSPLIEPDVADFRHVRIRAGGTGKPVSLPQTGTKWGCTWSARAASGGRRPLRRGDGSASSSPCRRNSIREILDANVSHGLGPTRKRIDAAFPAVDSSNRCASMAWSLGWALAARRICTGSAIDGLRRGHARLAAFQTD